MIRYLKLCCLVSLCALAGCNEIWLKRGGTPQDMDMAQAECRNSVGTQQGDTPAFAACMQGKGWSMHRLGADSAADSGPPHGTDIAPVLPSAAAATAKAAPAAATGSTPQQADQQHSDLAIHRLAVSSWWKLGAGPGDLDKAERQCITRLGVVHRPDPGSDIVTAQMYACLRDQGWYGVKKQ